MADHGQGARPLILITGAGANLGHLIDELAASLSFLRRRMTWNLLPARAIGLSFLFTRQPLSASGAIAVLAVPRRRIRESYGSQGRIIR